MISTLSNVAELSLHLSLDIRHVAHEKCLMCCMWFAHECALAAWAYMLRQFAAQWDFENLQGCRFSVIFCFFPLILARSVLRRSVSRMLIFSMFSYFIFLFLNFLSLVFIFCETARTRRFSVIFAKVQWHPWIWNCTFQCNYCYYYFVIIVVIFNLRTKGLFM